MLAVDEAAGSVYVSSNRDAVIDKQTYALALDGSSADKPVRITKADGWHEAAFAAQRRDCSSTPSPIRRRRRKCRSAAPTARWSNGSKRTSSTPATRTRKYMADHLPTEYGTLKANDGQTLHYSIIKPADFDASKRYPVFLSTYGGPHSQHVTAQLGQLL